jgi:release factor glutamine methyltransferase
VTTARAAIEDATRTLDAAGVPSPRFDAEELLGWVLGCERTQLWRHLDQPAPAEFDAAVRARAARVPLQHLTGRAYFRHLTLSVGPGVFVPRPETEVVVDYALDQLAQMRLTEATVVDLCSGSGAIALSIAKEGARFVQGPVQVHAVERDDAAVPWLRRNCAQHATLPVTVHHADLAELPSTFDATVDLVVANPPYIPADAVPRDPEVAQHDPQVALYSGADGLDHMRRIEQVAARLLRPGGVVVVEHADAQGAAATAMFCTPSWSGVEDHQDLTGRDRFVSAQRARRDDRPEDACAATTA